MWCGWKGTSDDTPGSRGETVMTGLAKMQVEFITASKVCYSSNIHSRLQWWNIVLLNQREWPVGEQKLADTEDIH